MAQHHAAHKLRATALVELTTDPKGNVAAHVIPITILANNSFRDASIYESKPRPMALGNGVVYEVQKTGTPVGYITITNGSHTEQGWVALGKWQTVSQVEARTKPKPTPAANTAPLDDRPILHREGQTVPPGPTPAPEPTQTPSRSDDSDRPVLHRGSSGDQQSSGPASQSPNPSPTPVPEPAPGDSDRPVLHRSPGSGDQQPATSGAPATTPTPAPSQTSSQPHEEPAPAEDPNRPVLKRRRAGEQDEPARTAPVASRTAPAVAPKQSAATPAPVIGPGDQTFVAVSDAESVDTRSFEYQWKPEEKTQIEEKMRKLALAQLPAGEGSEHTLTNVVIRSFDLDLSNDAVVVITADAPGGALAPRGKTTRTAAAKIGLEKPVTRYVTVIARVDIDGNPQKIAASVTDSSRLDVAPRLELIDAVDVDGDGLAELVFREYDFDQKSFIIYGVGHGTVTKVFEGASEPIK